MVDSNSAPKWTPSQEDIGGREKRRAHTRTVLDAVLQLSFDTAGAQPTGRADVLELFVEQRRQCSL